MKIQSFVRGPLRIEVALRKGKEVEVRYFPKTMSDAQVYAILKGGTPPVTETQPAAGETPKKEEPPTIPTPPVTETQPLTIKQMVEELETAGINTGYDKSKYLSVKSAYEKMKKAEADTL